MRTRNVEASSKARQQTPLETRERTAAEAVSLDAQSVQVAVLDALDMITEWIDGAANGSMPTRPWKNSVDLGEERQRILNGEEPRKRKRPNKGRKSDDQSGAALSITEDVDTLRRAFTLDEEPRGADAVTAFLQSTLKDSVNPWTKQFLDKLYTTPTTMSPAVELMLGAMNASGVVSSASPALCWAEEQCGASLAKLMHWDSELADALTMPGGSASNTLALQTALGNIFPSFKSEGVLGIVSDLEAGGRKGKAARPIILTSEQSHYSIEKAALGCGLGLDSVVKIHCNSHGQIDLLHLSEVLDQALSNKTGLQKGKVAGYPAFINLTSGTTVLGAFDDIEDVVKVCRTAGMRTASFTGGLPSLAHNGVSRELHGSARLPIWVHVDGSWGGPVLFCKEQPELRRLMKGIQNADSLTINPHKLLNVTQQCSFALFRDAQKLLVNVTGAKYLFHGSMDDAGSDQGESSAVAADGLCTSEELKLAKQRQKDGALRRFLRVNPGAKTMGCGRRPDAFKFYVEWLQSGRSGFGKHVNQAVSRAQDIRSLILLEFGPRLELAQANPPTERMFAQVCFRGRKQTDRTDMVKDYMHDALRRVYSETFAEYHTPEQLTWLFQSQVVHVVHQRMQSAQTTNVGTIDIAPLHHPHRLVGYYFRMITHPNTPFKAYDKHVAYIARQSEDVIDTFVNFCLLGGLGELEVQTSKLEMVKAFLFAREEEVRDICERMGATLRRGAFES